jgi:hypothetical protein
MFSIPARPVGYQDLNKLPMRQRDRMYTLFFSLFSIAPAAETCVLAAAPKVQEKENIDNQ